MSLHNIYKTLCDGLGLAPVNGSFVQALGDYFGVVDNPNRRYEDEVLVQALINAGGPGTASVELFDTFGDFPLEGDSSTLYVAKDVNIIYRWDEILPAYVILNDPDVVNPDAPEEGGTFYVRMATSSALRPCTYNNGTAGVGATLTATANGALGEFNFTANVIDNVAAVQGDVILVKNQTARLQNGVYEVTQLGDVSNPFILTRIAGYDQTAEIFPSIVFVSLGNVNRNRYFTQSTQDPIIGTDNLIFNVATTSNPASPLLFVSTVATESLPASTYAAGTVYPSLPGWGATLTANANGALGVINGVTMTSGLRIIVNGQFSARHNGTYIVTNAGSATQRWVLTRWLSDSSQWHLAREFTVTNPNSTVYGSRWSVSSPLSMANTAYGTTNIVFSQKNSTGLRRGNGTVLISDITEEHTIELDSTVALIDIRSSDGVETGLITVGKDNLSLGVIEGVDFSTIGFSKNSINIDSTGLINLTTSTDLELFASGDVDITADNGQINTIGTIYVTSGDIILNSFNEIKGGDGDGLQNGQRPKIYLGNAQTDDFTWEIGSGASNRISSDATDLSINANVGNVNITSIYFNLIGLPIFDSEAAASGLTTDTVYKTSTGELRIKL